jgi:large subunit ribosomal protein L28
VSHSHGQTNPWWNPNMQSRKWFLVSENRWVTLWVSARGIRTVDKQGIEAVVRRLRKEGHRV